MNILGVNYYFHDSSACVVRDGELIVAIEEERLSREKHTTAFPRLAIDRCLAEAGLEPGDIDEIALSVDPTHLWTEKAAYFARTFPQSRGMAAHGARRAVKRERALRKWLGETWPRRGQRPALTRVQHHASHAAGSFFVSPFEEAALLCVDGSGEWATSLLGWGRGTETETLHQSRFPMSLGSYYEAVTEFCGFRPNYDEGKTMGLAPYGDPDRFYDTVSKLVRVDEDGGIHVELDLFTFQHDSMVRCAPAFAETFGRPRQRGEDFEQHHKDVAAAFQRVLEERALEMCQVLHRKTGSKNLVISGGVALNSVMNGRIVREGPFEEIYVMPGAGDNGTAIGAAYVALTGRTGKRFDNAVHDDPYVGPGYTSEQLERALARHNLEPERPDDVIAEAARLLGEGRILGWFQGRMEFGPRALGNRSILANPTLPDMKAVLNAKVKHREAFRPFAPSSPVERAFDIFDSRVPAPFMLKVCNVRPDWRAKLPAITHVDNSARLQTVDRETNPRYHALLNKLDEVTGAPVVLNTSFNVMGQPIVESPDDAIECFLGTGIEDLILGDFVVSKPAQ